MVMTTSLVTPTFEPTTAHSLRVIEGIVYSPANVTWPYLKNIFPQAIEWNSAGRNLTVITPEGLRVTIVDGAHQSYMIDVETIDMVAIGVGIEKMKKANSDWLKASELEDKWNDMSQILPDNGNYPQWRDSARKRMEKALAKSEKLLVEYIPMFGFFEVVSKAGLMDCVDPSDFCPIEKAQFEGLNSTISEAMGSKVVLATGDLGGVSHKDDEYDHDAIDNVEEVLESQLGKEEAATFINAGDPLVEVPDMVIITEEQMRVDDLILDLRNLLVIEERQVAIIKDPSLSIVGVPELALLTASAILTDAQNNLVSLLQQNENNKQFINKADSLYLLGGLTWLEDGDILRCGQVQSIKTEV